jgi:hypothetical protein
MIDVYCERIGPGLLAEPLNAVTNASFLGSTMRMPPLGKPLAISWYARLYGSKLPGTKAILSSLTLCRLSACGGPIKRYRLLMGS